MSLGTHTAAAEPVENTGHSDFEALRQIVEENNIIAIAAGLNVQAEVEAFSTRADSCQCFYNREAESACTVKDTYLPNDRVFVIQRGQPFRLRIGLEYHRHLAIPVKRVVEVCAKIKGDPDEHYVSLNFHTLPATATYHEILVFLDPGQLRTKELLRPTRWCAETSNKYVQLDIVLVVNVGDDSRRMELYFKVFFKVIRKRAVVFGYKCSRWLRKFWEYMPQEARDAIHTSVAAANHASSYI